MKKTPAQTAKQIGIELGQSSAKGDARLAVALSKESSPYTIQERDGWYCIVDPLGATVDKSGTEGAMVYHCELLNTAYALGAAHAIDMASRK